MLGDGPQERKRARWWRRPVVLVLISVYVLAFLALNALGARTSLVPVDCVVVPGARITSEGTPGPSLLARLDRAVEVYNRGGIRGVVCTGGRGDSGHIEAEVARDYLVDKGVPASAIALETMSHTTWENFLFARDEMSRRGWKSCLVTTDPYHMERCLAMAGELGIEAHAAPCFAGPGWRLRSNLFYTSREMAAWLKYLGERAGRAF